MAWNQLFVRKPLQSLLVEATGEHTLRRVLGPSALMSLGVGAIVGAGIFVLTGEASAEYAGPAIILSFILAGIGCAFAGLCYAEMASMIPVAGSAYTYSYATMGEFLAWIIGWDLVLEYSLGASTVAVGWSGYVVSFLRGIGIPFPPHLAAATGSELIEVPNEGWKPHSEELLKHLTSKGIDLASLPHVTAVFNLPALLIVLAVTALLVVGIKESARVNNFIVVLKLAVLLLFIIAGLAYLIPNPQVWQDNWKEFIPPNRGEFGKFGWSGIFRGAGVIFFAYIGFDAVSTAAQESKNPQRDMPIGILGSLAICTILYIVVAGVLTSIVHYSRLMVADPVAIGIDVIGQKWLSPIIKLGAIGGLTSVILVMLLAQSRIFWTMACDGLLPPFFTKIHPRFKTPYIPTILTGLVVGTVSGLLPINILGQLVSIGTLLAFILVCAGVMFLRYSSPDIPRPFKAPWVPLTPLLGIAVCLSQMVSLPFDTWLRLIIWMGLGLVVYFAYGLWHSKLKHGAAPEDKSISLSPAGLPTGIQSAELRHGIQRTDEPKAT